MVTIMLGVDPGLATGLCALDITEPGNPKKLWSGEVSVEEFYSVVPDHLYQCYVDDSISPLVVCENFLIRPGTGKLTPSPWSLQLIGIVQYFCWLYDIPLHLPNPSAREFTTHEMLKKIDLWHTGGEGHAMQAIRHCVAFMAQHDKKLAKRLML